MRSGPAGGVEIDGGVADEERLGCCDAGARNELEEPGRIGLAAELGVAADDVAEECFLSSQSTKR